MWCAYEPVHVGFCTIKFAFCLSFHHGTQGSVAICQVWPNQDRKADHVPYDRITGFDASAHLSEETTNASWNAPIGVLMSVGCSAIFGFFLLISLLFSIQDFESTVDSEVGQPVLQILVDVFGENGAIALMTLVMVCVWHCGLFSMTSNSRMMFGFSRDGGLPQFFNKVR